MESKLTAALDGPGFSVVVEDQSGGCGAQYVSLSGYPKRGEGEGLGEAVLLVAT